MKKLFLFLLCVAILFCGCSVTAIPEIEDFSWVMVVVQSRENAGQVIAYGPYQNGYEGKADFAEIICTAKNGTLTLEDKTNGRVYNGTYRLTGKIVESAHYDITIEKNKCVAVVAMTTYHDKTQDPTFIINSDDYSIKFFAKK